VVAAVVVITVAVAVPAGYSLARLAGRWGERLGMGIFFTYLIPPTLLFVPFARLISLLGLQDSLASLILIYPTMTIPFCTWLVMGFLRSVPWDIEEQAMIDGYSRLAVIVKVAPRLIVPGILTVIVFTFTLVLQEFVRPYVHQLGRQDDGEPGSSDRAGARRRVPLGGAHGGGAVHQHPARHRL